jgi:hypothetical protein
MSLNPSCRFFLEGFNKFTLELHSGWCSDKISLRAPAMRAPYNKLLLLLCCFFQQRASF